MNRSSVFYAVAIVMAACGDPSTTGDGDSTDSATTAPLTNPTSDPETEADSAADLMNLDSSKVNLPK